MPTYKNNMPNNIVSVSLKDGGGSVPKPVTSPRYSFQGGSLVGSPSVHVTPVSPTGSNLVGPNPLSYGANLMPVGSAVGSRNSGGITDEGVVIGNPNVDNTTFGNSYGAYVTPTSAPATPSVDVSYNANSGSNGASSGSTTPPASNEAPITPPKPPENPTTEEAGTYYDYLKDEVPESLRDIYNDEIFYQDQQNAQVVEDIKGIRDTTVENAGEIRDTAYENAEIQKETTYTYADKVLMDTLGFNEKQYEYLLKSIINSKITGLALAEDVRETLLSLATETRDQIYKAAEAARVREYEQAEIVRQRGIVDANTSYEQNKATYGANAEALASMGLTGSGYSDYLNSQAYATQRGEVQAANADAEATKRAARYAEDDKKMNADATYAANVKEAELNYSERVSEINATYEEALRDANLWKTEADFEANRENSDTKFAADTTYNAAIGEADASYAKNVADANLQADLAIADANAATAEAKHRAEQALEEGLLTNEQAVAQYKDEMFYYFLEKAGAGNYTAEQLEAIANELDFIDTQKKMLNTALGDYNTAVEKKEEEVFATNFQTVSGNIKADPDYYTEADLDKMVTDKLLSKTDAENAKKLIQDTKQKYAKEDINSYIYSGNTESACKLADECYNNGNGWMDKVTYQKVYSDSWAKDISGASITADNIDSVLIELNRDKQNEKISDSEYQKLKKDAWGKVGTAYTPSQAGISDKKEEKGKSLWQSYDKYTKFKMEGTSYKCSTNMWYNPELDGILNGISTGEKNTTPEENTIVKYNGKTYAYMNHYVSQSAMGAGQITGFYTSWIEVTKE